MSSVNKKKYSVATFSNQGRVRTGLGNWKHSVQSGLVASSSSGIQIYFLRASRTKQNTLRYYLQIKNISGKDPNCSN